LCTFGIVGRALVGALCDKDPSRLKGLNGRFSSVVYPGDAITVDIWKEGKDAAKFRARVAARDVIVFNNGQVMLS
jgi:acyl dehydratase